MDKEKSAAVREAVAAAMGRIGPDAKDAVPSLGTALKDASPEVRIAAADALFRMGSEASSVLKDLREAISDTAGKSNRDAWRLRLAVARVIRRIGRPDAVPAVPDLITALNEPDPKALSPDDRRLLADLKRQLIEALGSLGDVAAAGVLTKKLDEALTTKDAPLGRTTLTALTRLAGDKKALLPALIRAMAPPANQLQDHHIRCAAIYHVAQLGRDLGDN